MMNLKSKIDKDGGERCICERRENSGKRKASQHLDLGNTRTCQASSIIAL